MARVLEPRQEGWHRFKGGVHAGWVGQELVNKNWAVKSGGKRGN